MKNSVLKLIVLTAFVLIISPNTYAKEGSKPIIIQGAMNIEIEYLIDNIKDARSKNFGGWYFWEGTIEDYPVVIAKTEIGMTNAAASTVMAIEKFSPRAIINQGTAGGHDPSLHSFDIVIGQRAVDYGAFRAKFSDYNQGVHPENWLPMDVTQNTDRVTERIKDFKGDYELIKTAQSTAFSYKKGKVVQGVIGSADQWNRELDRIKFINQRYSTSVEEMETAAAAQIAKRYNIAFLGIRILSNSELYNEKFNPNTGKECQKFVLDVVRKLIKQYKEIDSSV